MSDDLPHLADDGFDLLLMMQQNDVQEFDKRMREEREAAKELRLLENAKALNASELSQLMAGERSGEEKQQLLDQSNEKIQQEAAEAAAKKEHADAEQPDRFPAPPITDR